MIAKTANAEAMALTVGVDPNTFRDALRSAKFPRKRSTDWEVKIGSPALFWNAYRAGNSHTAEGGLVADRT